MLSLNKSCKNIKVSLTIHCKYEYFDSTVQRAVDRRQKFNFCRLPFVVNVKLNLSTVEKSLPQPEIEVHLEIRFIFVSVLLDFQSFTRKPVFECSFARPMILVLSYLIKNSIASLIYAN